MRRGRSRSWGGARLSLVAAAAALGSSAMSRSETPGPSAEEVRPSGGPGSEANVTTCRGNLGPNHGLRGCPSGSSMCKARIRSLPNQLGASRPVSPAACRLLTWTSDLPGHAPARVRESAHPRAVHLDLDLEQFEGIQAGRMGRRAQPVMSREQRAIGYASTSWTAPTSGPGERASAGTRPGYWDSRDATVWPFRGSSDSPTHTGQTAKTVS
jgi:hypothetical protein